MMSRAHFFKHTHTIPHYRW